MAWFYAALPCRDAPELFFPLRVSDLGESPTDGEAKALAVCRNCPFQDVCLEDRLDWEIATRTEPFGVCGGLTACQRRSAIRTRKRVAA